MYLKPQSTRAVWGHVGWAVQKSAKCVHHVDFSHTGLDQEIAALRVFRKNKLQQVIHVISGGLGERGSVVPLSGINLSHLVNTRQYREGGREMEAPKSDTEQNSGSQR